MGHNDAQRCSHHSLFFHFTAAGVRGMSTNFDLKFEMDPENETVGYGGALPLEGADGAGAGHPGGSGARF